MKKQVLKTRSRYGYELYRIEGISQPVPVKPESWETTPATYKAGESYDVWHKYLEGAKEVDRGTHLFEDAAQKLKQFTGQTYEEHFQIANTPDADESVLDA